MAKRFIDVIGLISQAYEVGEAVGRRAAAREIFDSMDSEKILRRDDITDTARQFLDLRIEKLLDTRARERRLENILSYCLFMEPSDADRASLEEDE